MSEKITPLERVLICRVFPLPFIATGLALTIFQVSSYFSAVESKSWPEVSGILEIVQGEYHKEISYRYLVNGSEYISDRVVFGEIGNRTPSREREIVRGYPTGGEVRVYYQPRNPAVSTLNKGLSSGGGFVFLLGSVFLIGGVLMTILLPKGLWVAEQYEELKSDSLAC